MVHNGAAGIQSNQSVKANFNANIITGNGSGGYLTDSSDSTFVNNIISANTGPGIQAISSTTDVINHNIIAANTGEGIRSVDSPLTVRNCVIQANTTGLSCTGQPVSTSDYNFYYSNAVNLQGTTSGNSDIVGLDPQLSNPRFRTPWKGSFSIQTTSPLRYKGSGMSDIGLLTPSEIGQLASGALGYSHLPEY